MKKLFGLLSVVLVAVICFTQPVDAAKKEKRAKYVFYFIGDGMGINQVNGTEMYLAESRKKRCRAFKFHHLPGQKFCDYLFGL